MRIFSIATIVAYVAGALAASVATPLVAQTPSAGERVDPRLIARGRYLVKTTGCNDCHTPGYAASGGRVEESRWLTGDRLGWQGSWGTTYPPNLRLLTQGLSAEQWLQVARRPMRPPMPWFALRDMTDQDLLAIYYFARSLGPAGTASPAFLPPGQPARTPVVKVPS